ncbi:MAG: PEGA domain-containing protein [Candidatus Saccharibacteria bacterium]
MDPQTRRYVTFGGLIGIAIIGWIIMASIHTITTRNTGLIEVQTIVPTDATATLDSKKILTGVEVRASAGKHTLTVSRDGFASQTQTISVVNGQDTKTYSLYLSPSNGTGQAWLTANPGAAIQLEGRGSRAYDQLVTQNDANNPIVQQLPMIDPQYRIDYGVSAEHPLDEHAIGIYIQASNPQGRQLALGALRDKGFDPSDLEIIFVAAQD